MHAVVDNVQTETYIVIFNLVKSVVTVKLLKKGHKIHKLCPFVPCTCKEVVLFSEDQILQENRVYGSHDPSSLETTDEFTITMNNAVCCYVYIPVQTL